MHAPQTEVILRHADAELARVVLPPGEYIVGRDVSAEVHAETPLLSRQHARLTIRTHDFLIEDLGSANGTFVNEHRVTAPAPVALNQNVRLGDVSLVLWREAITMMTDGPSCSVAGPLPATAAQRYDIGAQIARGGMGAILDARDTAITRSVAMKVMLEGNTAEDTERFVQEARITGQLEHPNIVPVHELSTDEHGQPYYTMKFVRGITLRKVLELLAEGTSATAKKYPLPALLTLFQKVCDAMAFAHSKGVIHRDLKPENIMLGDFGEVLVMDWGLAKIIGSAETIGTTERVAANAGSTLQGSVMGTPQYMSPEQARGEIDALDARTDIYALGAILFHLLALRPSVSGDDAWTIVTKVARGEVEPLENAAVSSPPGSTSGKKSKSVAIPRSLAAVVRKAMAFDRAHRYASVAELQRDIEAFQSGFATSAEKAGLGKQLVLAIKRNIAAAAGIAAVLIVGSVFGTNALMQGRRAERALAELKKSAPAFAAEADALVLKGEVDNALARLDTAIQLDSENPRWHGRKGQVLSAALRFTESADAFHRAALLEPDRPWGVGRDMAREIASARQPDGTYPMRLLQELHAVAIRESRSGDALLLSAPLKLAAKETIPLWQAKLNAWLGKSAPKLKLANDGGFELELIEMGITDLTPLKGMPLASLNLSYNRELADLSPLVGMPLRKLEIQRTRAGDLSPLKGMRLESISVADAPVSDLSPLRGMPLTSVSAQTRSVEDIGPLSESPLTNYVRLEGSRVTDLAPLAGKKIAHFWLPDGQLKNLSVIRGMPLKELHMRDVGQQPELMDLVMSLPNLELLTIDRSVAGFERLRTHPTLKILGHDRNNLARYLAVSDYWPAYDAEKVAAGKLAALRIRTSTLPDGTKRVELDPSTAEIPALDWTNVSRLILGNTKVSDLSPIRGVKLKTLSFQRTQVVDLEPLRGSPVIKLAFMETGVTDVSPLLDCPNLEVVVLSRSVKNVEVLHQHPKLRHIGYTEGPGPDYLPETTAEQFWKEYDAAKR